MQECFIDCTSTDNESKVLRVNSSSMLDSIGLDPCDMFSLSPIKPDLETCNSSNRLLNTGFDDLIEKC